MLTCESWSWNFHNLSCMWGPGDVKKDVVITGVHVRSLQGGASQQSCLTLRHLEQHVGDEERRAVVLWEDLDGELVPGLMVTVCDAEDDEVFVGVTVVVVIVNNACFDVTHSEHETLST